MENRCPVCELGKVSLFAAVQEYDYVLCDSCGSISINAVTLSEIDLGRALFTYSETYWQDELPSARERAYGVALARMAEALYYARIPVRTFLDVGTGPGYFLDAAASYLPNSANVFYGVERFPPPAEFRTGSPNYRIGEISDVGLRCDAGLCMEVIEHLTPTMLRGMLKALAGISNPGALYVFNTGMPEFVMHEEPGYLDPTHRGHIVSYSAVGVNALAEPFGFRAYPIPGKTWAFALEFRPTTRQAEEHLLNRIWNPVPDNMEILTDKDMGSVLRILGQETARAY